MSKEKEIKTKEKAKITKECLDSISEVIFQHGVRLFIEKDFEKEVNEKIYKYIKKMDEEKICGCVFPETITEMEEGLYLFPTFFNELSDCFFKRGGINVQKRRII